MKLDPHAEAIFFDMDGTLLDWRAGQEDSWRAASTSACRELDDGTTAAALYDAITARRTWLWAAAERAAAERMDLVAAASKIVELALNDLGVDAPDVARRTGTAYRELRDATIALIPGAIDTLERLRAHGIAMALITNGAADSQRRSVDRFGLAPYFDCIVIEGEFGCGKPDERVFRHALAAVGHPPERCWMIGDNLTADIATPVRLGMHTVWIDEIGDGLPAGTAIAPHRVIRTIAELLPA